MISVVSPVPPKRKRYEKALSLSLSLSLSLIFSACLLIASTAGAVEFRGGGQWLTGFGLGDVRLLAKTRTGRYAAVFPYDDVDRFPARQRLRLWLEALVSESLSGTVMGEVDQQWGKVDDGAALGARAAVARIARAYLDWRVPRTDLKVRMGLQKLVLPNVAGGSAVMDMDVAGVAASWPLTGRLGLTFFWARPFDDNYEGGNWGDILSDDGPHELDNMDLFALALSLRREGFAVTPWIMYGLRGRHAGQFKAYATNELSDVYPNFTLAPYGGQNIYNLLRNSGGTGKRYGSLFWAGLPLAITAREPWNLEVDVNYGFVEAMGQYDTWLGGHDGIPLWATRSSTRRSGWLVKALAECRLGRGTPGVFGWYASGDDGHPENGSERMPSLAPRGDFTSFLGAGRYDWGLSAGSAGKSLSYAGTWGMGLRLKDVSFLPNLTHSLSVAWWGGTNSTGMIKYMDGAYAWNHGAEHADGPYLTTRDGLLEFNLANAWRIYPNLEANLELGYIVNLVDSDAWSKAGTRDCWFGNHNAWKVEAIMAYTF